MVMIPNSEADWVRRLGEFSNDWWYDLEEIVELHNQLHVQFGDSPTDGIVPVEQELSVAMRSKGMEHRHNDALAQKAATVIENPAPVTLDEVLFYVKSVMLDSQAVEIIQDLDGGPIYINVKSSLLKGIEKTILKTVNRNMPPGVTVKVLSKTSKGVWASAQTLYQLKLDKRVYAERRTTTWEAITEHLRAAAAAASSVFKADQDPAVPFRVVKSEQIDDERLVTGAVLVPDVVDLTTKNADGSKTGATGDVYNEVEVRKAMYWWMENSGRTFTYHHLGKNGMLLNEDDVQLLEIWQVRKGYKEGEQEIPKGTWMMTARVHHDALWDQIKKEEINSWSIGANAVGQIEEMEVAA